MPRDSLSPEQKKARRENDEIRIQKVWGIITAWWPAAIGIILAIVAYVDVPPEIAIIPLLGVVVAYRYPPSREYLSTQRHRTQLRTVARLGVLAGELPKHDVIREDKEIVGIEISTPRGRDQDWVRAQVNSLLSVYEIPIEQVTGESAGHHGRLRVDLSPAVVYPGEFKLSAEKWAKGVNATGIPIAHGPKDEVIRWKPEMAPHILISGITGAGKTVLLRLLVSGMAASDGYVVVADPKGGSDFNGLAGNRVRVISDLATAAQVLDQVTHVMSERQSALSRRMAEIGDYSSTIADMGYHPLLVVVDEAGTWLGAKSPGTTPEAKQRAADLNSIATAILGIAQKGRSAMIYACVGIQRPDISQLGTNGGALRDQFSLRAGLRSVSPDGARMLWPGVEDIDAIRDTLAGVRGRVGIQGISADDTVVVGQVPYVDPGALRDYIRGVEPGSPGDLALLMAAADE